MLPNWLSVGVLVLAMIHHDAEVISKYRNEGKIGIARAILELEEQEYIEQMSHYNDEGEALEEEVVSVMDVRDDGTKTFVHGMRVEKLVDEELGSLMDWVRTTRFVMDNSVKALYRTNAEVREWVKQQGGYTAVQEKLTGVNMDAFDKAQKRLKLEIGYEPAPLGEPTNEVPADSATKNSAYAVQVHRDLVTKKAFGEVEDDDTTTPNWAASEFDFDIKRPWWWRLIAIGRRPIHTMDGEVLENDGTPEFCRNLISQILRGDRNNVPKWRPNICIGDQFAKPPYKSLYSVYSEAQVDRNLTCQEFIYRFYNEPERLVWKKVNNRWMGAMRTPMGKVIWCPVTKKSTDTIDFFTNDGARDPKTGWFDWSKTKERSGVRAKRCIYLNDKYGNKWVMPYQKIDDHTLRVWKMKSNNQTGLFEIWKVMDYELPYGWSPIKKKLLAMGGVDAYFGHPEKLYKAPQQYEG